jgi:hypothetical protein
MIKNIVAIYPGRFQPFGKHHATSFKWLESQFGSANCYIATSNVVTPPKSPFSFQEKQDIIRHYGFSDSLVQVKNPYKAEEILSKFNPADTAVVFMVGSKDMQDDPRFAMKAKKDGSPSYFQSYVDNKSKLQGFDKHGYLVVGPHVSLAIPGFGEMSGTSMRQALGAKTPRSQKQQLFKGVFGWYDTKTANMIFDKLEALNESKKSAIAEIMKKKNHITTIVEDKSNIFSKQWWTESLDLQESFDYDDFKIKFKKFIAALKQEGKETKQAFVLLAQAAQGKKTLTANEKKQIGDQMKDVLKALGLTAIAVLPGGLIAGLIIKLLKAEKYVTPSAFMTEASLKPNVWKDFNLASLSKEDMDIVWSMYSDTYAKAGLDFSANDAGELQIKYKAVYLEDVDSDSIADAFIIYKPTPFGNKISLLGTNDKKEAKKSMLTQLFKLLKTQGWFIEASMKMEDILSAKSDITAITNEKTIQALVGAKGIEIVKDGYYKRKLAKVDKTIVKRLYGKPKTSSLQEGSMSLEREKIHNDKMDKLQQYLDANIGRPFVYDFEMFPKTVVGVKIYESLLLEGGAGGHMAHPFNIDWVKTGKDILKVFQMSVDYLEKGPAAVKIDGVNASIRFVNLDGKKQFVMDRGSMKPLDVKGITKDELTDRFGEGHGMIKVGGTVLDIFNESLPKITSSIKKLGLWDNPNIMFNLEYVAGSTNVLSYNKNFLAVHGLLELEQVTPKRRGTKEIEYNEAAMQDLLNNLQEVARKYGYEVLGSIPTTLDSKPDFNSALNEKYTVDYGDKKETKTLSQWLAQASVPDTTFKTKEGKVISALSKDVLIKISEGVPLSDYITDPADYKAAIDGFAIYLATMKLGDAVLEKLSSPLGPVSEHEGIVIRDERIYDKPFKITGSFIIKGMSSSFKK